MGRYKKDKSRADLWTIAGGIDAVANELRKADVLKRNTEYSSEIWTQLSMVLFNEDTEKNRHWLWVAWTKNRRGLRDRTYPATEEGITMTRGVPENGTEEKESGDQGMEVADMKTQYDVEVLERERDATDLDPGTNLDTIDVELGTDSKGQKSRTEAMKEGKSELSVWRECPEVSRKFFITVERDRWNKIRPLKGSTKLRQPWTDCLYNSFKEINPCCTLSFKYQHVKALESRKRNAPYLRISAVCSFPSCTAKYSFKMKSEPATRGKDVKILVHQTGDIHHKLSEKKCRPATHKKRGKIAKALSHGPSEYFYTKLQATPKAQLLAGNMSECLTKSVLKVIGSEIRRKEAIHSDILKEVYLMQTILKECDTRYFKIPGYIQHFSMNPFMVHMYTELGISILVDHLRGRFPVSLYLDATGGVVSKIPDQPKCVFYYALALPGKGQGAPALPVCEMLTNEHSIPPIAYWLTQFVWHLTKYTQLTVHKVETDYSWALIQSVMLAFNKEHLSSYLNRAYDICMGKKSWEDMKSVTVLHICAAHILKAVRQAISRQTRDKGLRDFVTFAFARLQNAITMNESKIVFSALCTLLTTPQNTVSVKRSLNILESVISRSKEDTLEDIKSEDLEMLEDEDQRHAKGIVGSSPFYAYFQQVMKEAKEQVAGETCLENEDNPYFCPGIINVLFDTYLAIFPLWSGLLLGDLRRHAIEQVVMTHEPDMMTTIEPKKTRDTNNHIERWFGIVKHSIMQGKKKVRPGTFIRTMYRSMQARYTEHIIQHNLSQELLLRPLPPKNIDQSQETWRKKSEERFRSTKSKYFTVPQNIPTPQKKKKIDEQVCDQDPEKPLSHVTLLQRYSL